uniref:Uncharacterized protein n=1 Tax=Anguilla anguilla TaxID=7936 RepID=A0A0E9QQG0_ANGAN
MLFTSHGQLCTH